MPKKKQRSSAGSKKRTAIIVIHGIGEQMVFETLDSFGANFARTLQSSSDLKLDHLIATRTDARNSIWQEQFIQIDRDGKKPIDVHEFYWAYITEGKATIDEILAWVEKTLWATKKYYSENVELEKQYEKHRGTKAYPLGRIALYLRIASYVKPIAEILRLIFSPISPLFSLKGYADAFLKLINWIFKIANSFFERHLGTLKGPSEPISTKLLKFFQDKIGWIVTAYIGDVAIYTTVDEKSKYFRIRQQILNESQVFIEAIMNNPEYDRVIIAGHSLGSVIAYDTLNRINIKANLPEGKELKIGKLSGLITFGSPLDKIAFFFREHTKPNEFIRRQILAHLHSFKAKPLTFEKEPIPLSNPLKPKLDTMEWINFYDHNDPVSGHLDFYNINDQDNIKLDLPQMWGAAHTGYWTDKEFYNTIINRFDL